MEEKWYFNLIFIIMGICIGSIFWIVFDNSTGEIGQAICEKRFDMDFDSYDNKVLKCKDKEVIYEEQYDGITIQIK